MYVDWATKTLLQEDCNILSISRELGIGTKTAVVLLFVLCLCRYVPVPVCVHVCGEQSWMSLHRNFLCCFFETGSPIGLVAIKLGSAGLVKDPPISGSPALGLQVNTTTLSFLQRFWGLNSGLCVCKANTLLAEPFPQLWLCFQISLLPLWSGVQFPR